MKSILAIAFVMLPGLAAAHAMLESATPAVGGTVHTAPAELALSFSEGIEPRFSKVAVTGPDHAVFNAGALHTDPADAKHLLVPVAKMPPGTYTVTWHAVSVDTHRTQGIYHFTIAP